MIIDSMELNVDPILLVGGKYNIFQTNRQISFSGIYLLKVLDTEKVYTGSSVDIKRRIKEHFSDLRRGTHSNQLLQRAFNKYGEESFFFYLMEDMPRDSSQKVLCEREQFYLDSLQCFAHNRKGYNIAQLAVGGLGNKEGKVMRIKDPAGVIHEFTKNISIFAREQDVAANGLVEVLSGKIRQHKGWHLPETKLPSYTLEHFDGRLETFSNIRGFAAQNDLQHGNIIAVLAGRAQQTMGWFDPNRPYQIRIFEFLDPQGIIHRVDNIKILSEENKLKYGSMLRVVQGKRNHHKKWKFLKEYHIKSNEYSTLMKK